MKGARPSVVLAMFPLETLSPQNGDEQLARGFSQDLLTELARFPSLGVVSLSSEDAKNPRRLHQVAAGFFLQGSLRRTGKLLRISLQLVEADTGCHVWAGRYDEDQLPELGDEVTARIAAALAIQVDQSVLSAARRRPETSLEAYECWLRGMDTLQRGTTTSDDSARRFFERALESDPHYARAYAGISLSHFNDWSCQAWTCWEEKEKLAYHFAVQAEALDPADPTVQMILARIEQYRRHFALAGPRLERALALSPNDAGVLMQLTLCFTYQGEPEKAWAAAQRVLDLNPFCPTWYFSNASLPLFCLRKYEDCLAMAAKGPPNVVVDAPAYQAAANAYLGRADLARSFLENFRRDFLARIAQGREPEPTEWMQWLMHVNPYQREEDIRHFRDGLRMAGIEDTPPKAPVNWPIANTFRKEGAVWVMAYQHETAQLPNLRGFDDLARLLASPGETIPSSVLAGAGLHAVGVPLWDDEARKSLRRRLQELEEEIAMASRNANEDIVRACEEEREAILLTVRKATGLGGRARKSGSVSEKARTAVTWRIRHAIKKIAEAHPALGRHLKKSVKTGAFCSYEPEIPVEWSV